MNRSMLDLLVCHEVWEHFYKYKQSLVLPQSTLRPLRRYIDSRMYTRVYQSILEGNFPLPERSLVSKLGSEKKRVVYTYPEPFNTSLKLLTYLIIREYDGIFMPNLYSFRSGRTAKDAVRYISRSGRGKYAYKADISSYFNSVDVPMLLPMLKEVIGEDERLYSFLSSLLTEKYVLERGVPLAEQKGIMAGTPLSAFYADLFLRGLDRYFYEERAVYARYSDDIIVFAGSMEELMRHKAYIQEFLGRMGLALNTEKERVFTPEEGWEFLGFCCHDGMTDISPVSLKKLKQKMRRKTRALKRWSDRNGISGENAARAFIRIFSRKLFGSPYANDLCWSLWYFPVINTDKSLKQTDRYAQDCVRYLISGKRTKSRYNVRYSDMKKLGLPSLVNEYHRYKKQINV